MDTDQVDITVSRVLFKLLLIVCYTAYQGHYVWKEILLLLNVIVLGFEHHKKIHSAPLHLDSGKHLKY